MLVLLVVHEALVARMTLGSVICKSLVVKSAKRYFIMVTLALAKVNGFSVIRIWFFSV